MRYKILAAIGVIVILSVSVIIGVKLKHKTDEAIDTAEEVVAEETDATVAETDATTEKSYTITFVDGITDKTFKEIEVEAGESVDELPEAPEHDGYQFTEYEGNYSNVASDETIVALYEEITDDKATNSEDASSDSSNKNGSNSNSSSGIFDDIDFSATVNRDDEPVEEEWHENSDEEIAKMEQELKEKGIDTSTWEWE